VKIIEEKILIFFYMLLYGMLLTSLVSIFSLFILNINKETIKKIALATSLLNLVISLFLFIIFDFSNINFQFVQEITEIKGLSIYIGVDGISIYFILLTTFIMPLVILSN
jgi:NADH-ubiquinone oxidoreductase chain 4